MNHLFQGASSFNSNISRWDVTSVTKMHSMFSGASSFNSDISLWNVSSVTDMFAMFYGASSFNSDISNWNISSVTNMKLSSMGHQASIPTFHFGMLALSQTWLACSVAHQASTKTSVLGVPSCLLPSLMEACLPLMVTCFVSLVAPTRTALQDLQGPGVL